MNIYVHKLRRKLAELCEHCVHQLYNVLIQQQERENI